jgi:hypothetical protein
VLLGADVYAALIPRALLFDSRAYLELKVRVWAARVSVLFLLLLGLTLGAASAIGGLWAGSAAAEPADVQRLLLSGLERLPLWQRLGDTRLLLQRLIASSWLRLLMAWFHPGPVLALWRLAVTPLLILSGWLFFGTAAQILARRCGGRGPWKQSLGCLALADAPRTLGVVLFLAPLSAAHILIGVWVLAARFQALKAAHGLEVWRAFWIALASELLALAGQILLLGLVLYAAGHLGVTL